MWDWKMSDWLHLIHVDSMDKCQIAVWGVLFDLQYHQFIGIIRHHWHGATILTDKVQGPSVLIAWKFQPWLHTVPKDQLFNLELQFKYVPSRQFWDCGRWKSDSLWNFRIVGCQLTVNCLLGIQLGITTLVWYPTYNSNLNGNKFVREQVSMIQHDKGTFYDHKEAGYDICDLGRTVHGNQVMGWICPSIIGQIHKDTLTSPFKSKMSLWGLIGFLTTQCTLSQIYPHWNWNNWIENSGWNSKLNTDSNWNSKLDSWSVGRVYYMWLT